MDHSKNSTLFKLLNRLSIVCIKWIPDDQSVAIWTKDFISQLV